MRILGMDVGASGKEDIADYWRKTAEKRGGEIGIITFACYQGRSGGRILELPGLMYTVGDSVWFEDFEKSNWLSKIISSKSKYEKTEMGFTKGEVAFTRVVSRGTAIRCISGSVEPQSTRPLSPFARFFITPVLQIGFSQGHSLFFEIMKREELESFLVKVSS